MKGKTVITTDGTTLVLFAAPAIQSLTLPLSH
jgi:hypothetical protein